MSNIQISRTLYPSRLSCSLPKATLFPAFPTSVTSATTTPGCGGATKPRRWRTEIASPISFAVGIVAMAAFERRERESSYLRAISPSTTISGCPIRDQWRWKDDSRPVSGSRKSCPKYIRYKQHPAFSTLTSYSTSGRQARHRGHCMSKWTTAFRSLKMYLLMNRSSVDSVYRYPADGRGLLPQDNTYLPIHRRHEYRTRYEQPHSRAATAMVSSACVTLHSLSSSSFAPELPHRWPRQIAAHCYDELLYALEDLFPVFASGQHRGLRGDTPVREGRAKRVHAASSPSRAETRISGVKRGVAGVDEHAPSDLSFSRRAVLDEHQWGAELVFSDPSAGPRRCKTESAFAISSAVRGGTSCGSEGPAPEGVDMYRYSVKVELIRVWETGPRVTSERSSLPEPESANHGGKSKMQCRGLLESG
ncbi:hypothetical protein GLOTRDRAFT_97143 [Gloeophyllum trabeum ATCC 11539]|uniref:Uncharacterized protein n=1 Tax=Gloeophyllum trabeum (strain ATCC 11539 / FP-39264 / Madison 617) TaxID=670483 RepID=S7PQZ4_GLOTA|nr:uncharacterized protein GLOTRDRAFT_97143 [Gloeophyllum trabeum ATCC 11539]EPQ50246.1 hypothetical protein GLOTRDRAFT_97143 [Gloeophyllum trabeum ATCC 11539]